MFLKAIRSAASAGIAGREGWIRERASSVPSDLVRGARLATGLFRSAGSKLNSARAFFAASTVAERSDGIGIRLQPRLIDQLLHRYHDGIIAIDAVEASSLHPFAINSDGTLRIFANIDEIEMALAQNAPIHPPNIQSRSHHGLKSLTFVAPTDYIELRENILGSSAPTYGDVRVQYNFLSDGSLGWISIDRWLTNPPTFLNEDADYWKTIFQYSHCGRNLPLRNSIIDLIDFFPSSKKLTPRIKGEFAQYVIAHLAELSDDAYAKAATNNLGLVNMESLKRLFDAYFK